MQKMSSVSYSHYRNPKIGVRCISGFDALLWRSEYPSGLGWLHQHHSRHRCAQSRFDLLDLAYLASN